MFYFLLVSRHLTTTSLRLTGSLIWPKCLILVWLDYEIPEPQQFVEIVAVATHSNSKPLFFLDIFFLPMHICINLNRLMKEMPPDQNLGHSCWFNFFMGLSNSNGTIIQFLCIMNIWSTTQYQFIMWGQRLKNSTNCFMKNENWNLNF